MKPAALAVALAVALAGCGPRSMEVKPQPPPQVLQLASGPDLHMIAGFGDSEVIYGQAAQVPAAPAVQSRIAPVPAPMPTGPTTAEPPTAEPTGNPPF